MVPDIPKWIKQQIFFERYKIKYLENLSTLIIFLFSKYLLKSLGILNLNFLFLTITFLTFFCLIFLFNDCLIISTSGNSGI